MDRFMIPFRMHDTGWLLFVLCVLFGIGIYGGWIGLVVGALLVASLLLHEVGHMLVAIVLRVPVREFGLCLGGAYNRRGYAGRRRDEILISAAGPLMNLVLVFPLLFLPRIGSQIALCNLLLFVVNLLPIPTSDGSRILLTLRRPHRASVMVPTLNQPPSAVSVPLQ